MKTQSIKIDRHRINTYFCSKKSEATQILRSLDGVWLVLADSYFKNKQESLGFIPKTWPKVFCKSGEQLKSLASYELTLKKINAITQKHEKKITGIIAIGGGTIGDFAGFIASTYKRGIDLIHIPSTWLAAIDSSHGGKTALNIDHCKNQIGSYYFPQKIILLKSILLLQNQLRAKEALGELVKTYLYSGNSKLLNISTITTKNLWSLLPEIVLEKYKIIKQDPFETKAIRYKLNLGHTVGHVLELHYKLPHGVAVYEGIQIAIDFSLHKKILSKKNYDILITAFKNFSSIKQSKHFSPMPESLCKKTLVQDKKMDQSGDLHFVFVKNVGKIIVQKTNMNDLIRFLKLQGWIQ